MSEMIERVAQAIEATMFAPHELPVTGELHERYLETASAAIEAMREPTHAMDVAASNRHPATFEHLWQAAIDAALDADASQKKA
jgi:hypothetical protein